MHVQRVPDSVDETVDSTCGGLIPPMTDRTIENLRVWMDRDVEYATDLECQHKNMAERLTRRRMERGPAWWEYDKRLQRARRPGGLDLIWPVDKVRERAEKRKNGKKMAIRFSKDQLKAPEHVQDRLIPIRIDLEHEQSRFQDTFIWNAAGGFLHNICSMWMCG